MNRTVIKPEYLLMRKPECFYCQREFQSDYCIENIFGIRYCKEHSSWAERDCKAYVNQIHKIPAYFAITDADIRDFVNIINIEGISIQRSNGEFERNWFFNNGSIFSPYYIIKQKGTWSIPLINKREAFISTKNVLLSDFMKPEFRQNNSHLSESFYKSLKNILEKLERGLYKKEYDEHIIAFETESQEKEHIQIILQE